MDLLGLLAALVFVLRSPAQERGDFPGSAVWEEAWSELADLERSAPDSAEFRRIWTELDGFQARRERSARKKHDRPETFRARVLQAHLLRLTGAPARIVEEPGAPITFLPGEAWIAVRVIGPGPTRVSALESALAEAVPRELGAHVDLGLLLAEQDARELHLDWALEEARALDARLAESSSELASALESRARTASLYARILRLRGEHGQAIEVLERAVEAAAAISRPLEERRLLAELARARLPAGDEGGALRDLGSSLALGSAEAGLLLARRALSRGELPRARALYRSLLEQDAPPPSAARGYGLSLLGSAGSTGPSPGNPSEIPR